MCRICKYTRVADTYGKCFLLMGCVKRQSGDQQNVEILFWNCLWDRRTWLWDLDSACWEMSNCFWMFSSAHRARMKKTRHAGSTAHGNATLTTHKFLIFFQGHETPVIAGGKTDSENRSVSYFLIKFALCLMSVPKWADPSFPNPESLEDSYIAKKFAICLLMT